MIEELFTPASDASFHTLFCTQTKRRLREASWEEEWGIGSEKPGPKAQYAYWPAESSQSCSIFNWIKSYFINNLFHFYLPWHCCVFQKKNCLENVKWLYWNKHRLWHNPEIVSKLILSSGDIDIKLVQNLCKMQIQFLSRVSKFENLFSKSSLAWCSNDLDSHDRLRICRY